MGPWIRSYNTVSQKGSPTLPGCLAAPPTTAEYDQHRIRLDTLALQGSKLIFFAHSQGNLFANAAYEYVVPKIGAQSVGVVHVAPASPRVNGEHTLADKDFVINGLRAFGSVPSNTTTIPLFADRPAGLNGSKDRLGHGLLEVYLNPALATRGRIDGQVRALFSGLTAPPARAEQGFFTVTLTWNGAGDVDLHTFEPNGTHVFYASRQGTSGFLDVDNTVANGPEHYFATCNQDRLQTGTYRVGINNFQGATGRTATVQLASYREGPLLTRSLSVGPERGSAGNSSPIPVFDVLVVRNPETGRYFVRLE